MTIQQYEVTWVQTLERKVTALVKATSIKQAIEKAKAYDIEHSDEEDSPLDVIEQDNYSAKETNI